MWVARAVLAFLLTVPYTLIVFVVPVLGREGYTVRITMACPSPAMGQLFFDVGQGIREEDSSRVPVVPEMRTYDFGVQSGTVRALRLDPGATSGRYTIRSAEILRPDRARLTVLDVQSVSALNQLSIVDKNDKQIVFESPPGSTDPYFYFNLPAPLELKALTESRRKLVARLFAGWLVGLFVIVSIERLGRHLPWPAGFAQRLRRLRWRPTFVIVGAATVATCAATYPLVFFNRSLVSPGNGPVAMLYDHAPFVPGSQQYDLEDARGGDVGAAMWAFVPYSVVERNAIRHGEWPLWLRNSGAGRPLWGQGQSFLLDPLHWLTLIGADPAPGWDLKFIAHRLVFAIGIGTAAFFATGAVVPAAIAAAATPFSGLYAFRFNHPAAFAPTYAPWILVAWFALGAAATWRVRWRYALLLALATTLTTVSAPPKEALVMVIVTETIGLLALVWANAPWRQRVRGLAAAGMAGVVAILVSAPDWLVFLDTLRQARTTYDAPVVALATQASALGFVLGNLTPLTLQPGLTPLAVALSVCAVLSPFVLKSQRSLAACAVGAAALIALGFGAVPTPWLLRMPLVRNISHFGDVVMTALMVPVSILAAGGIQALRRAGLAARTLSTVVLAVLAVLVLSESGGIAAFAQFHLWLLACIAVVVISVPFTVGAAVDHPARALPYLSALVGFVMLSELGGLHLNTGRSAIDKLLAQPTTRVDLSVQSPAIDQARAKVKEPTRAVGLDGLLFQGTQALYGLEGIGGPDALEIGPYEDLLDAGGTTRQWGWLTLVGANRVTDLDPLLDLLNVGIVVTHQDERPAGLSKDEPDQDLVIDTATRPSRWPRAFFVDGVRQYATLPELMQLVRAEHAPFAAVEGTDNRALRSTYTLAKHERGVVPATDYVLTTNGTAFRVDAPGPGIAVLTETYVRDDFRATLNGTPVPYLRVNHAFKGVVIPGAGVWNISFVYRPRYWNVAWIGAALGVLIAVVVAVAAFRRRPSDPSTTPPAPDRARLSF